MCTQCSRWLWHGCAEYPVRDADCEYATEWWICAMGSTGLTREAEGTLALPRAQPAARSAAAWNAEAAAVPWWLWWNILSLDAPMVGLVWAALFVREGGGRLGVAESVALALAVWLIYTTDRLLDGWSTQNRAALRARHLVCERHRRAFAGAVVAAGGVIVFLAVTTLPLSEVRAGCGLGVVVAAYMVGIHLGRGALAQRWPKELAVGILFAAGATLPWWWRGVAISFGAMTAFGSLAVLCAGNCMAIESWERAGDERTRRDGDTKAPGGGASSKGRAREFAGGLTRGLAIALAGIAGVLGALGVERRTMPGALAAAVAGTVLLLALHGMRRRLTPEALRVLADAALLVPPVVLLMVGGAS